MVNLIEESRNKKSKRSRNANIDARFLQRKLRMEGKERQTDRQTKPFKSCTLF